MIYIIMISIYAHSVQYQFCRFLHFFLRAVVMTDALQFILMLAAILAIIFMGLAAVGGWTNVWEAAERGNRLELFK